MNCSTRYFPQQVFEEQDVVLEFVVVAVVVVDIGVYQIKVLVGIPVVRASFSGVRRTYTDLLVDHGIFSVHRHVSAVVLNLVRRASF